MKFNVCKVFWDNWILVLQGNCYAHCLSPFLPLSFSLSLRLTVHFARVFLRRIACSSSLSWPRTVENCNSILCDLLLPHSPVRPRSSFLLPSHMIMRYSSLRGSSPNCQRHRLCAPRPPGPFKNHSSCVQHNKIKLTHRWLQSSRCQLSATPTRPLSSLHKRGGTMALKHYR